jgi:glucan phosphorylase
LLFNRDAHGIPRQWISKIRHAMATCVNQFNTARMVSEYAERYYLQS